MNTRYQFLIEKSPANEGNMLGRKADVYKRKTRSTKNTNSFLHTFQTHPLTLKTCILTTKKGKTKDVCVRD